MKKLTSLLISCSLALAGAALAQQPDAEASPTKKQGPGKGRGQAAEANAAKPGANAGKPQPGAAAVPGKADSSMNPDPQGATKTRTKSNQTNERAAQQKAANAPAATAPAQPAASSDAAATTGQPAATTEPAQQRGRGMKKGNAKAPQDAAPAAAEQQDPAAANAAPQAVAPAGKRDGQRPMAGAKKKPDAQQVQQIRTRHANFRAQPRPQQVPTVTFQQNYRIQGADRWEGPQYEVYRSYRPERHDRDWYHSRYQRVELVGGGYYYWNNGYWYPAWGYAPQAEYYAYDAPIYVGQRAEPPDKVIANVQATLQEMGHYKGEVDGLLGPLTREALTAYQAEQGLVATAVIDQPTLDSLGMS